MEKIHLSKFTTQLQGLCHDGYALYDVNVREKTKNGSFCDCVIKRVTVDEVKKQVVVVLEGNSRIDELETENARLRDCFTCSDCIKVQKTIDQRNVVELKEAIKIIKKLSELVTTPYSMQGNVYECKKETLLKEAESFIKDNERFQNIKS